MCTCTHCIQVYTLYNFNFAHVTLSCVLIHTFKCMQYLFFYHKMFLVYFLSDEDTFTCFKSMLWTQKHAKHTTLGIYTHKYCNQINISFQDRRTKVQYHVHWCQYVSVRVLKDTSLALAEIVLHDSRILSYTYFVPFTIALSTGIHYRFASCIRT